MCEGFRRDPKASELKREGSCRLPLLFHLSLPFPSPSTLQAFALGLPKDNRRAALDEQEGILLACLPGIRLPSFDFAL